MKKLMTTAIGLAVLLAPSLAAAQENWPQNSIRFIVPYAPGGYTDTVGRITARYLSDALGQTVVVENRGGAGGIVGTDLLAQADPDGYTFCVCSSGAVSVAPLAESDVNYDPLKDFAYVSLVSTNPQVVIANPKLPITSLEELIAYAKENPGELNYGSSGMGGLMHFSVELFQSLTDTELTHVPYAGGAPATAAVVAGEVDLTFTNASDAIPQIANGAVRGLAVTSAERSEFAPDLPAVAELVPGFSAISWNGIMAPAGTPPEIVDRLAEVLAEMADDPEIQQSMRQIGATAVATTPEEFRQLVAREVEQWTTLLAEIGYEAN